MKPTAWKVEDVEGERPQAQKQQRPAGVGEERPESKNGFKYIIFIFGGNFNEISAKDSNE